jgi:hypothetical protein
MLYGDCRRWMTTDAPLRGLRERLGLLGDCLSEDDELRQLVEGVASAGSTGAGSLAVWMGVFSRELGEADGVGSW